MKKLLLVLLSIGLPLCGERYLKYPDYGTHMTPLITAVAATKGAVLELGCGDYSTPLLHAVCAATKRLLVSVESDVQWLSLFLYLERPWHQIIHLQNGNDWYSIGQDKNWSVVFVDQIDVAARAQNVRAFKDKAEIVVVHDSENGGWFGNAFDSYKYRYDYTVYMPHTTLLSNTINVAQLFE